ncbi:hypothetical protein VSR68_38915 [Paraburkholderia phymatum]|uniref:hypothetical protein n=1 Tax=Paraburkholderia phymatum TaxID=148447 RepID=UPI00316BCD44
MRKADTRLSGRQFRHLSGPGSLVREGLKEIFGFRGLGEISHAGTREQRAKSSTVQGIVTSNDTSHPHPTEQSRTITADVPPAIDGSSATLAATASTVVPRLSEASSYSSQNREMPSQNSTSSDKGHEGEQLRLRSLALARAHGGLQKNDLHTARSGVYWALSLQPDNREALLLKVDLISRERARDAALTAARSCVEPERRQCVWQNASNALSIDSSSTEAKALVKHSATPAKK